MLTAPAVALALHAPTGLAWHIPALFDAALADEPLHAVQNAMFFDARSVDWMQWQSPANSLFS